MGLPDTIHRYLTRHQVVFTIHNHPPTTTLIQAAEACNVPLQQFARAVVLVDGHGLVMAVLPADHVLDFESLSQLLGRSLEPVPAQRLTTLFDDCDAGSCPPLGLAYSLPVVADEALRGVGPIAFEPGRHNCLLQVTSNDFSLLLSGAQWARFSSPISRLHPNCLPGEEPLTERSLQQVVSKYTPARVRKGLDEFHDLPTMPITAQHILQLAHDPSADARSLGQIIEQDASLAAQVLRYANSPLYGFSGKISDIKSAIARVLGFEFVMHLALGLSIGRSLKVPLDGPLGLNAFWKHSVYAARLTEQIAFSMPHALRPRRGTAYLAGLLQNLGTLALGQSFQAEFFLLNRFVQTNAHLPICDLERHVLGVAHTQIGSWLLESWGMPAELIQTVRHHHDPDYCGEHAVYPNITLLANRLLMRHGIGCGERIDLPDTLLNNLGLNEESLLIILEKMLEQSQDLDHFAQRLAA